MKKHILVDGRNLYNLIKNNSVFRLGPIYYIISANLVTREKTNIADLSITEEFMRELYIRTNLTEWADDCALDNGETEESSVLQKQFASDLVKSFPIFKEYFEENNEYVLFSKIDYVISGKFKWIQSDIENLTPDFFKNVSEWVSGWRDKNEVRNTCHYFTYARSEFPFFTDWGDYLEELYSEDKKTLTKKIKENDFDIQYGIEDENENTTAIRIIF